MVPHGVKRAGSLRLAWCVSAIGYMVMKNMENVTYFHILPYLCVAWYFYSLSFYCLSWNVLISCPAMKISNPQVLLLLSFVSLILRRYAISFHFFFATQRNCNITCRFETHILKLKMLLRNISATMLLWSKFLLSFCAEGSLSLYVLKEP